MLDSFIKDGIVKASPYMGKTTFDDVDVARRPDGSFVLDGVYHVLTEGKCHANLYRKLLAYAEANPDKIVSVSPEIQVTEEDLYKSLRNTRNCKLAETDYLVVPDYPIDVVKLEEVKAYRTALRDITELEGCPWDGGGSKTPWPKNPLE